MSPLTAGILLLPDAGPARPLEADPLAAELGARLAQRGWRVHVPEVAPEDWRVDRRAIREIGARADAWRAGGELDGERLAVLGFGRGGTLAFLLGCAQRFAAVIDVDGPVVYRELDAEHPTHPLELALNLEGEFLGLFGERNPAIDAQQRELLRQRLVAAARPFEIAETPGADPGTWRSPAVRSRLEGFLERVLAPG